MSQQASVRCANGQQLIRYHPISQQASMSRPLLQNIADTIREVCSWHRWNYKPSVSSRCWCYCLKVSGWSGTYQIPSHEPASIREVCQWSAVYQIASMSRRCGSAGIRELVIWYRWNYEPSVSSRCWCYCLKVSGWSAAYQIPSHKPAGIYEPSVS